MYNSDFCAKPLVDMDKVTALFEAYKNDEFSTKVDSLENSVKDSSNS